MNADTQYSIKVIVLDSAGNTEEKTISVRTEPEAIYLVKNGSLLTSDYVTWGPVKFTTKDGKLNGSTTEATNQGYGIAFKLPPLYSRAFCGF